MPSSRSFEAGGQVSVMSLGTRRLAGHSRFLKTTLLLDGSTQPYCRPVICKSPQLVDRHASRRPDFHDRPNFVNIYQELHRLMLDC